MNSPNPIKQITLALAISTVLLLSGLMLYGFQQQFTVAEWRVQLHHQWMTVEPWRASSINALRAGSHEVIAFVPGLAVWVGTACLIALLLNRHVIKARAYPLSTLLSTFLICFFIGWVLLDVYWQRQLEYTRLLAKERYENKTLDDKRVAADDGDFYAQLMEIKRYLPTHRTRLIVATADNIPLERYLRLRTRYHLLPHNILLHIGLDNFSDLHKQSSDYLLVVTLIPSESPLPLSLQKVIEVPLVTLYRWQ